MTIHKLGILGLAITMVGCAAPSTDWVKTSVGSIPIKTNTITAQKVTLEDGPTGITNTFAATDSVYSYTTVTWRHAKLGRQNVEARWFNNGVQVLVSMGQIEFDMDPYNVWFNVPASRIGTGKCRVELLIGNQVIGNHEFEIK